VGEEAADDRRGDRAAVAVDRVRNARGEGDVALETDEPHIRARPSVEATFKLEPPSGIAAKSELCNVYKAARERPATRSQIVKECRVMSSETDGLPVDRALPRWRERSARSATKRRMVRSLSGAGPEKAGAN
jgi:hypothetical protein